MISGEAYALIVHGYSQDQFNSFQVEAARKVCGDLIAEGRQIRIISPTGSIDHGKTYIGDEIADSLRQTHPKITEITALHAKTTTRREIEKIDDEIGPEALSNAEFIVIG